MTATIPATPSPTDAPATPTANPTGPNGGTGTEAQKRFSQAELDAILRERLDQEKRQRERAEQSARADAEAKALVEQQKYQELAEARAKRIAELETLTADFDAAKAEAGRYKAALGAHLATQRADLPAHLATLLDKLDPVEQLEWIAANQAALMPALAHGGIPPSPRGDGANNLTFEQRLQAEYEAQRRRRR